MTINECLLYRRRLLYVSNVACLHVGRSSVFCHIVGDFDGLKSRFPVDYFVLRLEADIRR